MLRVLILDDSERMQNAWKRDLGGEFELVQYLSQWEAWEAFQEQKAFDAIAVDACVPGDEPNTLEIIQRISSAFEGPLIAISSEEAYRKWQMDAGCTHECSKDDLPEYLRNLFG